ncbi:lysosome membrane protein 2-like isoform X2 [Artemia franciscana]|uniref:Uncharacterized protein n=1 Tax=Artemia franciscana TaxID=6661 RepID=A0AA88L8Y3_ARTSF|nr:hypothetical protein QYM36_003121 [Artemia franciscana]
MSMMTMMSSKTYELQSRKGDFSLVPTSENDKKTQKESPNKGAIACASVSLILGVMVLAVGLFSLQYLPEYFENQVKQKAPLRPGTPTWDSWLSPPVAVYSNFTFFNVENPEEVLAGGKPVLTEKGPYVYREYKKREVMEAETPQGTIIYREVFTYEFDEEKSHPLKDSDKVTVVNPVAAAIGGKMEGQKKANPWIFSFFEDALTDYDDGAFITETVRNLLEDGYDSAGLKALKESGIPVPATRFEGLLLKRNIGKNESYQGVIEIDNGSNGYSKLGRFVSWNGERELDIWPERDESNSCNQINGTDGTLFGPYTVKPDPSEKLYVFIPDLCRSLFLRYERDTVHYGITTHRYTVPYEAVAGPSDNPGSECFCPNRFELEECDIRTAIMPKDRCQPGSPVIMSTPHFYLTNWEELFNDFDGLSPEKSLHETYMDLDPVVSVPLSARKRLQANIKIRPAYPLPSFANLAKEYVFPLMWIEQGADFTEAVADRLKSKVYKSKDMLSNIPWVGIGFGIACIFGSIVYFLRMYSIRES